MSGLTPQGILIFNNKVHFPLIATRIKDDIFWTRCIANYYKKVKKGDQDIFYKVRRFSSQDFARYQGSLLIPILDKDFSNYIMASSADAARNIFLNQYRFGSFDDTFNVKDYICGASGSQAAT